MKYKVCLFGSSGRMGQILEKIISQRQEFIYVGGVHRSSPEQFSSPPDVIIDFSLPQAFEKLRELFNTQSCPLVSGTTGLSSAQKQEMKKWGKSQPILWSSNMSLGIFLLTQCAELVAQYHKQYNFQIHETHHIHKKDKPSGTARTLQETLSQQGASKVSTLSLRKGENRGEHQIRAENPYESLEISHKASSRELFAQGALDVALWLVKQKPGFYGIQSYFESQNKKAQMKSVPNKLGQ